MNFRLALRSLLKTPLVTGVAVLSLALGVGANAAIFSLFEQMVLKSLPVPSPDRLVFLRDPGPKSGSTSNNVAGGGDQIFSYPMLRDLQEAREARTVFTGIAGHRGFGANLAYAGDTLSGEGVLVSGSYFEVLGLRPALGRLLSVDDDRVPGAQPVAVLAHSYWRARFDASPDVLGESLVVNGLPMTIVGVAPRGFKGTSLGISPQVFVPLSMRAAVTPGWEGFDNRRSYWIYLFARLEPGVEPEQAQTAVNGPFQAIVRDVEVPLQTGASEQYMEQFAAKTLLVEPGRRGQSSLQEEVRMPLLMLLGVSGFVLLIACANIANLLLVRSTQRAGEIAVRMSIGARRRQVVAQLLAESFVLALAGSAGGYLAGRATLKLVASILPSEAAVMLDLDLGPAAWAFLALLTLVTGCVGLFPAWHSTRGDLAGALRRQAGNAPGARGASLFRSALVTVQIALSLALLTSAGLFTQSLVNVGRVDLGLDVGRLATFGLSPELNRYSPVESRGLFERVESELRALPGVTSVAASMVPLISSNNWGTDVTVEGFDADPDTDTNSNFNEVGPGFFRTVGIPLLAGRELEPRDDLGAPKVAVVSEAFVRKFELGAGAVGKRMRIGSGDELDMEIVGVAADAKYSEVKDAVPPLYYVPYRQDERLGSISFYVRTEGDPEQLLASVRGAVARLDPDLPIENLRTMELQVRENVVLDRMLTTLSAAFAILATVLAAVGLYGVMAYSVAQRTREIGLRMALGADAGRVRALVLRQVGLLTLVGGAVGLAGALGLGRAAGSLLYGLTGDDPRVFTLAALALAAVALGAGLVPAQRAARVDPMRALRHE